MRLAFVLVVASGCRWVFGIHDTATTTDDAAAVDTKLDGPPDSAAGGCVVHSDCASGACVPDGSCADPQDIAWVNEGGSVTGSCTQTMPCARITTALATNRKYIRVHGTIDDTVSITTAVMILADPGAQLIRTTSGTIMSVQGSGDAAIYDLELNGASGVSGINVIGTLSLQRCHVRGMSNGGISSNGTLVVSRSVIDDNLGGGVIINGGVFTITNSMIVHNGNNTSDGSGVRIMGANAGSVLELDTIAANATKTGGTNAGGVACNTAFAITHCLLAGNTINNDPNAANSNYGLLCDPSTSDVVTTIAGFVQPVTAPYDFHLTSTSPAIDASFTSSITIDYDGVMRPLGSGFDYGADEYQP